MSEFVKNPTVFSPEGYEEGARAGTSLQTDSPTLLAPSKSPESASAPEETLLLWRALTQARDQAVQAIDAAERAKREVSRLREELTSLQQERDSWLRTADARTTDFQVLQDLELEREDEVRRLRAENYQRTETEISLRDQLKSQFDEISKLRFANAELEGKLSELTDTSYDLIRSSDGREKELDRLRASEARLKAELQELTSAHISETNLLQAVLSEKRAKECEEQEAMLARISAEKEAALTQIATHEEISLNRIAAEEAAALTRVQQAEQAFETRMAKEEAAFQARMTAEEAALKLRITATETTLETKVATTEAALQAKVAAEESALEAKIVSEVSALRARLEAEEASFRSRIGEEEKIRNAKFAEREAAFQAKISKEESQLQAKAQRISRMTDGLTEFAAKLNGQKKEVKVLARQLCEEMQAGEQLHPLKDYLSLTDFELSKLEVQLKKTPASSPERTRVENCLTEMITQRDFLRSVIEASRAQLRARAALILRISQDSSLAPVPPPSPSSKAGGASGA